MKQKHILCKHCKKDVKYYNKIMQAFLEYCPKCRVNKGLHNDCPDNKLINNMKTNEKIKWAKLFHNTYEELAPSFGYETREDTKEFDPESKNGKLMLEVCSRVLSQQKQEIMEGLERKITFKEALKIRGLFFQGYQRRDNEIHKLKQKLNK